MRRGRRVGCSASGWTLVESTVVLAILGLVLFSVGTLTANFRSTSDFLTEDFFRQGDARRVLAQLVREVRSAGSSSCGEYPVVTAGEHLFTFYTNVDTDNTIERLRYFLSGTDLQRGVIDPTEPVDCTGTVYDPAEEVVQTTLGNLVNGAQGRPIFRYYPALSDGTAPLGAPVTPSDVHLVEATFLMDADPARPPNEFRLASKVGIRSVQVGAARVPSPTPSPGVGTVASLSKTDGRATAEPGDALVVNVAPRNTGDVTATDIDVTDTLPEDVSVAPETISHGGSYDASARTITWDDLDIPPAASTLSDGLIGYWRIDEGRGVYTVDHAGTEANIAQVREGITWSSSDRAPTTFLNLGSARFNAASPLTQHLRVQNSAEIRLGNRDFTIALWVKPTALSGNVFGKGDEYALAFTNERSVKVSVGNDNGGGLSQDLSEPFQTDVWQHLAVRRSGTEVSVYRNGDRVAVLTRTGVAVASNNLAWGSGPFGGGNWRGSLDDIRVYDRALGVRGIQTLAQGSGNQDNLSFKANVSGSALVGGVLTDTAESGALSATDTTTVQNPAPALGMPSKTVDRTRVGPGQSLLYTLTLVNNGDGPATGVNIADTLPQYTTFTAGSITLEGASAGSCIHDGGTPGTIQCTDLAVDPFTTLRFSFRVTVNADAPNGERIRNTATVTAPGYSRTVFSPWTTIVAITVTKTDGETVTGPGQTLRYRVSVRNDTTERLTGVTITDLVPTYTTFVPGSITDGGTYDAATNTITWSSLTVNANSTRTVRFSARVNDTAPEGGTITNTATVTIPDYGVFIAIDTTRISTVPILANPTKTDNTSSATVGSTLTYIIRVRNNGGGVATDVDISDVVPAYTTFVSGSITGGGTYNAATNTITWSDKEIGAFSTLDVRFRVRINADAPDGGTITNTATVTAPGGYHRSASDTTRIRGVVEE